MLEKLGIYNPNVRLAAFLIACGAIVRVFIEKIHARSKADPVYEEKLRSIVGADMAYFYVFIALIVAASLYAIWDMRRRSLSGLSTVKHEAFIYLESIFTVLFFVYLAYML